MPQDEIIKAIQKSWSSETAHKNSWSPEVPSLNQCAVTALIVQDYFGGYIVRAASEDESHYWNTFDDGTELDLTRDQFPQFNFVDPSRVDRGVLISNKDTFNRYIILRSRVERILSGAID